MTAPQPIEQQPGAVPASTPAPTTEPTELRAVADLTAEPEAPAADGVLDQAATVFTPPPLWTERQPSAAEELDRAKRGEHLPAGGPLRTGAIAYGYTAAAGLAALDTARWVIRHPARSGLAAAVLTLLLISPVGPFVAAVLFGIPHILYTIFG